VAQTQRFGLSHFGLGVDGSFSEDGGKHTGRDRRTLDRILAAMEGHRHEGGARVEDPDFAPSLVLDDTQGALAAGATFYYRVSFIDQYGLETAAGDEASVATFASVSAPAPPRLEAETGGTLDDGIYYYGLTGHSQGNETTLSPPQIITISDWNTVSVYVSNTLPTGTDEVSIWRQGPLESGYTRLATVAIGENAHPEQPGDPLYPLFVDDGSIPAIAPTASNQPPTTNLTNASNAVEVIIPAIPTGVQRWRLYRTRQSGQYGAASLVAEVVETEEEGSGALVTTFLDMGAALSPGKPLESSQTLSPSRLLSDELKSSGGGRVLLSSPDMSIWLVMATPLGQLETRPTGLAAISSLPAPVLTDSSSALWRVRVDDTGSLSTEDANVEPTSGVDLRFEHNQGPNISTPDPGAFWRLGVNESGELFTEGDPVSGMDLVHLRPVFSEPQAPVSGGVLYFQDGELRFKSSNDVVTTLV